MQKRIIKVLLAIAVAVSLLVAVNIVANAATEGDYTYTVSNGNATITGYTGTGRDVVIPSTLGGYPVTRIGYMAFHSHKSLTSITIPDSVTNIGDLTFAQCELLTSIKIPDSVTSIGEYAFQKCESLKSIIVPDSVTSIGKYAFSMCTSLTSVKLSKNITSIEEAVFWESSSLTSVTIPDTVTSIGDYAFSGCSSLTSVTIPDSVTNIGDYAFDFCNTLTDVYYGGTQEEWNAITIGIYNEPLANATIHFLGEPADYSAVETALAKVPADLTVYTDETAQAVTDAVNAVVYGLTADKQETVDSYAKAIEDAVANLEIKYIVNVGLSEDDDYVFGTKLVLVYTNADNVTFDYDGIQMFDVSGAGYTDNGTEYTHVYGLVVEALGENIAEVYEAKITVDYEEDATVIDYTEINDVNASGSVSWDDVISVYAVTDHNETAFSYAMAVVIKADTNRDKVVDIRDATSIIAEVYGD